MPRNGAGGYALPSGNPVVTGTTISSTDFNNTMTDLATAMAGSIAADGQTQWAGNQNANGNRITALGAAASIGDAVNANDVQTGKQTYLTAVAGTNTITASVALLTAYTAGECFRFVASGTNTGAVTLNINGLGALSVVRPDGSALIAGDIANTAMVAVGYDGTRFQLLSGLSAGRLIGMQLIGATGTYTPTAGTSSVMVELLGGGGAGGGCSATGAGQIAAGGGGASGGYARSRLTSGFSGVTVTIGAGGVPASGALGGNGGTTSFGAVFSAPGGAGGALGAPAAAGTIAFTGGGAAGAGSTGNLVNAGGENGGTAIYGTAASISGLGGASYLGGGGRSSSGTAAGNPGLAAGAGGSGSSLAASSAANAGGAGVAGACIVWEYA